MDVHERIGIGFLILIVVSLGISLLSSDDVSNLPLNTYDYSSNLDTFDTPIFDDPFSETDELHWNHMPLTYGIINESDCYPIRVERIKKAIQEVGRLTEYKVQLLSVKNDETPDISFVCIKDSNYDAVGDVVYETFGEALTEYYPYTNVISNASVFVYGGVSTDCMDYPTIELHEILHTLGEDHSKHLSSIMYKIENNCNKLNIKVDQPIFDKLIEIYQT